MTSIKPSLLTFLTLIISFITFSQVDGTLDPTFNLYDNGHYGNGRGIGGQYPTKIHALPNGGVILGGPIDVANSIDRFGLVKLKESFRVDLSFDPGDGIQGPNSQVTDIAPWSERFYISGDFTNYNGSPSEQLIRIHPSGNIDNTFAPNANGFSNTAIINDVYVLDNDTIIVCGGFSSYDGFTAKGICKIDTNGTIDASFSTGPHGFGGGMPFSIDVQPDGKIVAGGIFTSYNTTPRNGVLRLKPNGDLDSSFIVGSGFDEEVKVVKIQPDGKIIVGGGFFNYNGNTARGLVRLNTDGSIDNSFSTGTGVGYPGNQAIYDLEILSNGKIIVAGSFAEFNGYSSKGVVMLNSDGNIDNSFHADAELTYSIDILPNGDFAICGGFSLVNNDRRGRVAFLNPDGSTDTAFNSNTGIIGNPKKLIQQDDNKVLVGGSFHNYNAATRHNITRFHENGSVDSSFVTNDGFDSETTDICIQSDDKIIVSGYFDNFNNIPSSKIARLNPDGSHDNTFNIGTGFDNYVTDLILESNGKITAVGKFNSYSGTPNMNQIIRLNNDGSIDNTFTPPAVGLPSSAHLIRTIAKQSNGKYILGGNFNEFNGDGSINNFVRLNADGSIDATFNMGTGFNGTINKIIIDDNDKILVGGIITSYNGTPCTDFVRLNPDGTLDPTFNLTGSGINGEIKSILIQSDDKILICGLTLSYNGTTPRVMLRMLPDGSYDTTFEPGPDFNQNQYLFEMFDVIEVGHDKIIGCGNFEKLNSVWRNGIARFYNGDCHSSDTITVVTCDDYNLNGEIFNSTGIYKQVLNNGNVNGCDSTIVLDLTINNNDPVPNASQLPDISAECSITISTIPQATDDCDGLINAITDDTLIYDTIGNYTINWKYIDSDSNIVVQQQNIIINDVTAPVADTTNLSILASECEITISNFPTATDNCNGTIIAITNDDTYYDSVGTYTIEWVYEDASGNISSQNQTVEVIDTTAPIIQNCPNNVEVCQFNVANWTPPVASDNCELSGLSSNFTPGSVFPLGNNTVTYTATDKTNNSSTCSFDIIVNPLPSVSFNVTNTLILEEDIPFNLSGVGSPSGGTYSGSYLSNNTFNPPSAGNYTVTYNYTDVNGCSNSSSDILEVISTVSTNNVDHSELLIFPNPAQNSLNINNLIDHESATISLYDVQGKLILHKSNPKVNNVINIENFETGAYIIEVESSDSIFRSKIIKH